jgi:hypothetical protein
MTKTSLGLHSLLLWLSTSSETDMSWFWFKEQAEAEYASHAHNRLPTQPESATTSGPPSRSLLRVRDYLAVRCRPARVPAWCLTKQDGYRPSLRNRERMSSAPADSEPVDDCGKLNSLPVHAYLPHHQLYHHYQRRCFAGQATLPL